MISAGQVGPIAANDSLEYYFADASDAQEPRVSEPSPESLAEHPHAPGETPVIPNAPQEDPSRDIVFGPAEFVGGRFGPQDIYEIARQGQLDPCIDEYIEGAITIKELDTCLRGEEHEPETVAPFIDQVKKMEKNRKALEKETTGWGKFGLLLAPQYRTYHMSYPNIFRKFNENHPGHETVSNHGTIDGPGYLGTRLAVTTDPGYMVFNNTLLSLTILDATFSRDELSPLTILKISDLIPVGERSFLELGAAVAKSNLFTGAMELVVPSIGIAAQIRGESIQTNNRVLDATGHASFLQSYTLLQATIETPFARSSLAQSAKVFCNEMRLSPDESYTSNTGTKHGCNSDHHHNVEYDVNSRLSMLPLSRGIFGLRGEERRLGNEWSTAYYFYAASYFKQDRIELGGQIMMEYPVSPGVRLFLQGDARGIHAIGDDQPNMRMPASAREFMGQAGLRLVPASF
ncbi:MAG: hypothetical protein Q7T03_03400 [Deltaproteobacteria bacterium]|nr:hypothetical protein [Deltaproteobacteria bacterium]